MASAADAPLGVQFVYVPARDLAAMRHFYGELLGLREVYHSAEEGLLAYVCGGLQFTIFEAPDATPMPAGWATQPGWQGPTEPQISWSVVLDTAGYRDAVRALESDDVDRLHDVPVWVGYWSHPVHDPMGNTVEVTMSMEEPAVTSWSAFADDTSPGTVTSD